jgi:SAM-dependent methyltransferase
MRPLDREPEVGDAFGMALLAHLHGEDGTHVLERDDGQVEALGAEVFFGESEMWAQLEKPGLEAARGCVLDAGAGAGRHSLMLLERGMDVLSIDTSPGAIAVCRARGIPDARVASILDFDDGAFDTILMLGHNLAILGSREQARELFSSLRRLLAPGGAVIGTCLDPYFTDDPNNLEYHRRNIERGRMAGQVRMRERFRRTTTDWFDWLFVSREELTELAAASGWRLADVTEPDPSYRAVLIPE